jgi:ATP-binding cassette, subfamily A (ABC1), member 3
MSVEMEISCKISKSPPHTPTPLRIYQDHITILVGPKGAGKIKITPSVSVDGDQNVNSYRNLIGLCPKHSSLIPYFNCMENLLFFGQLRGLSVVKAREQAETILTEVELEAKIPAQALSIGMQRRLSMACAMIGGTKLLALDEPSSGLDGDEKRKLWDLLLRLKKNRTIVITTHDTVEADMLGDQIIIMDNGEVIGYGSSFFLKREHGNGYTLKLVKSKKNKFNNESVLKLIQEVIPNATMKDSSGTFMSVVLPYENQKDYVRLLERLEARQHELNIESIGVSNIFGSLEEVFLK